MNNTDLNKLIDDFAHLPMEDKEYAAGLINKQLMESRRDAIARRAKQAAVNYKKGGVKKGGLKDLYEDLESD